MYCIVHGSSGCCTCNIVPQIKLCHYNVMHAFMCKIIQYLFCTGLCLSIDHMKFSSAIYIHSTQRTVDVLAWKPLSVVQLTKASEPKRPVLC